MQNLIARSLVFFVFTTSCAHASIEGPPAPQVENVSRVVVTSIKKPDLHTITDSPEAVSGIVSSWAFAQSGWQPVEGREFLPLYKIEFESAARTRLVYWLGANSHPPRFPCYSFCTGWWVAPSTATGSLDPTRYKGLADAVSFPLFRYLELPE